jgi:hypothetical protein
MQRFFGAERSHRAGDSRQRVYGLGMERNMVVQRADGGTLLNPTHGTKILGKGVGVTIIKRLVCKNVSFCGKFPTIELI